MPADPARYAQRLYAALHDLDEAGYDVVFVERVPDGDAWARRARPAGARVQALTWLVAECEGW